MCARIGPRANVARVALAAGYRPDRTLNRLYFMG